MSGSENLIDFDVIETHKENIQSLPSGRSAKSLASVFSPLAIKSPSHTQDANDAARQEYETELAAIDDSDDPLDIYDRYVKWTLNTYPTAQATPQSQLLPLLERATKAFLSSPHYKNDPRYLRLWLHYTRFFSDAPRETFAYLSRHGVGDGLALYYEEFAAWLEGAGRWSQAEEVYQMGIEREARPAERLLRKFADFQKRAQNRPQNAVGPSSPALPTVRPALVAKIDPFSTASPASANPQSGAQRAAPSGSKKAKLEIFSDAGSDERPASGGAKGWENIGTISERKKENTIGARPWVGETLKSGTSQRLELKMAIFKDQSTRVQMPELAYDHPCHDQKVVNQRSGKMEYVFVNLDAVYPDPKDPTVEYCFEELRAANRGWLQKDWAAQRRQEAQQQQRSPGAVPSKSAATSSPSAGALRNREANAVVTTFSQQLQLNDVDDENDENRPPDVNVKQSKIDRARKMRQEEKANATRQIKVREVKGETQTIQTNLDSPRGPRIKRKKSADREATMTVHTRAAQEEIYDIFNETLKSDEFGEEADSEAGSEEEEFTSAGESTGTGRISATTSEYGEETQAELTETKSVAEHEDTATNTGWSDFDTKKDVAHLAERQDVDVDENTAHRESATSTHVDEAAENGIRQEGYRDKEVVTPTSPPPATLNHQNSCVTLPPENYDVPTRPYRDPEQVARSRLPFMTPIVEATESLLGAATANRAKDYFNAKTPCPKSVFSTPGQHEKSLLLPSSPFQRAFGDEQGDNSLQTAQNAIEDLSIKESAAGPDIAPISPSKSTTPKGPVPNKRGPIIPDKQCIPTDDSIRKNILQDTLPPLSSFRGYFDNTSNTCNRRAEIRKFCKSIQKSSSVRSANVGDRISHTTPLPPVLDLEGAETKYEVQRELGSGAFAPVYLVKHVSENEEEDQDASPAHEPDSTPSSHPPRCRRSLEALKMEEPPNAWEFYMLRTVKERLSSSNIHARAADSMIDVYEMHLFVDECYLIEEFRDQSTLLDLVNLCAREHGTLSGTNGGGMDETLAMFFAVELLRTLDALHSVDVVHGDLKADNVLLRFDSVVLGASYDRSGREGWAKKGISLIDFGRAIDLRAFREDVGFVADWRTGQADCPEMREARPWKWQADFWGLAGVLHVLLFGKYIETVAAGGAADGGGLGERTYRLKENLKRYWQTELWGDLFGVLLNSTRCAAEGGEQGRGSGSPALKALREVRERMEVFLERNGERGVGLRALIRRVEASVVRVR